MLYIITEKGRNAIYCLIVLHFSNLLPSPENVKADSLLGYCNLTYAMQVGMALTHNIFMWLRLHQILLIGISINPDKLQVKPIKYSDVHGSSMCLTEADGCLYMGWVAPFLVCNPNKLR